MRGTIRDARLGEVRILGLAGSVAVSVAAATAGALPFDLQLFLQPGLGSGIQQLNAAPPAILVLAYFGLTLLVGAWLRLGTIVSSRSVSPREMTITLAWWSAPLLVSAPLYSRDIYSYLAQGSMFVQGVDPYEFGPAAIRGDLAAQVSEVWQHTPAPYGPTFLLLAGAVMAVVGEHVVLGIIGMRLLAVAAIALCIWAVPVIARRHGVDPGRAMWLGVLNPLLIAHGVSGAHNDVIMVALILLAAVLVLRDRPYLAAVVIGVATLVKAPAIVALAFIVVAVWGTKPLEFAGVLRLSLRVGAAGLGAIAALTLITGTGLGWVIAMGNTVEVRNGLSMSTNLGAAVDGILRLLSLAPPIDLLEVTRFIGLAAAVVVTAMLLLRRRQAPLRGLAISLVAFVVLGPVVNPWYLLWGLVLLAATTIDSRTIRAVTITSVVLTFYPMPAGGAPTIQATVGLLGIAIGALLLWWNPISETAVAEPGLQQVRPRIGEVDADERRDHHEPQYDRDRVDAAKRADNA